VVASSWVTICSAFATPADAVLPVELPPVGEALLELVEPVELLDELHAARPASAVITAADVSSRLPGSLIVNASKRIQSTTVA
jgi:hypothetical protein